MEKRVIKKGIQGTWADLRLSPSQCMKLVVEGKLKIIGRDDFRRYVYYVLEDLELGGKA